MIATDIKLFGPADHRWIARILELAAATRGQPWRVLLERIDAVGLTTHPSRIRAVLGALRRVGGGRAEHGRIARRARGLVLGDPALDRDTRDARLAAAACVLGIVPEEVESLLWADLARERPVTLPAAPSEAALIAFANLDRIQRAVRRAREVRIRIDGSGHELVRSIARFGLLASATRDGDAIVFDIKGPLALFHATTVYGRAIAELVPQLAAHDGWTLDVTCELGGHLRRLHARAPVALPPARGLRRPSLAEKLARELGALGWQVDREPAAVAHGDELLFPDLVVAPPGRQATWIELVAFATAELLGARLAAYRAAGIERVWIGTRAEARQLAKELA